jgi:flavin reductase (DIM6/NTAB) family NADH-FMN oxidoreductase RutF
MSRINIPVESLDVKAYGLWENDWLLLCAGDFSAKTYNAMTVSWGSLGSLWNLPIAQVFVRPQRYTYQFIDRFDTFSLNAFPEHLRKALSVMGSRSGREGDKISQAGLTPVAATSITAPTFAEAKLVIECRKLYWQDLDPSHFLNPAIEQHYPVQDYHRIYIGEILAVQAASSQQ